jgi:UDP-N-acetylmuramoylalanine--D-glutamate ligase
MNEGLVMSAQTDKFFDTVKGKKVAFIGLGTSNLPLIKLFADKGAKVIGCDRQPLEKLGENGARAKEYGAELILGDDYLNNIDADIIFRSPGTQFDKPELVKLRENGKIVTSEMEVFFDLCPCKIIAVTGSDGKTTTTTIISELLKAEGKTVHLGGNIGKPLLPEIESVKEDDFAVVELSSFQLISMRKSPDIAVVTNLAPNHLDWHKDMDEYVESKKNVILHQNAFCKAVLNSDNEIADSFSESVRGQLAKFSVKEKLYNGAYLDGSTVVYSDYGKIYEIMDISEIKIPGMHNVENYLAAISAVWGLVNIDTIKCVAQTFGWVAHRAEFVRELDGVKYYNDSIASSPTRTALGTLSLYDEKIIIIAGGYDKHIPYEPLGPVINNKVKVLILLGDTAPKIEEAVKNSDNYNEKSIKIINVSNMEEAVAAAKENAEKGDIVSLSPASASFGLYKNFEERGNHFKAIVNGLT